MTQLPIGVVAFCLDADKWNLVLSTSKKFYMSSVLPPIYGLPLKIGLEHQVFALNFGQKVH